MTLDDFRAILPYLFAAGSLAFAAASVARARRWLPALDVEERRAQRAIEVGEQWAEIQMRIDYAVAAHKRHEDELARHRDEIDRLKAELTTTRRQLRAIESTTGEHDRIDSTNPGTPPNSTGRRR